MPGFGLDRIGAKGQLEMLLEQSKKVDNVTAQLILRDAYDVDFGVFDHINDRSRPLALVARHVKEDYCEYGGLYRAIYQYNVNEVGKRWNMSLVEFLDLPREYHRLILRICSEDAARALLPTEKQIRDLKNNQAQAQQQAGKK
ncbi:hypothetical protein D3C81_193350 [compost metagenome]|jgi:hypothetical protein